MNYTDTQTLFYAVRWLLCLGAFALMFALMYRESMP